MHNIEAYSNNKLQAVDNNFLPLTKSFRGF